LGSYIQMATGTQLFLPDLLALVDNVPPEIVQDTTKAARKFRSITFPREKQYMFGGALIVKLIYLTCGDKDCGAKFQLHQSFNNTCKLTTTQAHSDRCRRSRLYERKDGKTHGTFDPLTGILLITQGQNSERDGTMKYRLKCSKCSATAIKHVITPTNKPITNTWPHTNIECITAILKAQNDQKQEDRFHEEQNKKRKYDTMFTVNKEETKYCDAMLADSEYVSENNACLADQLFCDEEITVELPHRIDENRQNAEKLADNENIDLQHGKFYELGDEDFAAIAKKPKVTAAKAEKPKVTAAEPETEVRLIFEY
jgi:hypothetical protein